MKTTRKTNRNQPVDPRDAIVQQYYEQAIQKGTPFDQDAFAELMKDISRRLIETALKTELSHHLEGKKVAAGDNEAEAEEVQDALPDDEAAQPRNKRNGFIKKKVRTQFGELDIQSPRDRLGTFEPTLVPKRSRTMDKLNEQFIALYGRGMTVREIRAFLEELYGIDVSPDFISRATQSVPNAHRPQHSSAARRFSAVSRSTVAVIPAPVTTTMPPSVTQSRRSPKTK